MPWPEWWQWELEISPHVLKRMLDRHFTEVDLRGMIADATSISDDHREGRFQVHTRWERKGWVVVVEPDFELRVLVAVTAYDVR